MFARGIIRLHPFIELGHILVGKSDGAEELRLGKVMPKKFPSRILLRHYRGNALDRFGNNT